jgi:hypothetical protein
VTRTGTVTRLSRELDPRTRMMLVEVDLDNRDDAIVPGSFVDVILHLKSPQRVELPVEALIMRGGKSLVGVVKEGTLRLRPVAVAEDDGAKLRLASGLEAGEEVALNVGDSVGDGARVRPLQNAP